MLGFIYWNPKREAFTIPFINHPIVWYGVFFALGFAVGYYIFLRLLERYLSHFPKYTKELSKKQMARKLGERFAVYVIVATVIGARLGHFLFYENPSDYLLRPWVLLQTWKGGLASHGAAIAIIIAIFLFSKWAKKIVPLSWIVYLDLIAIPTAFAGVCIRVGNFFNQEILGTTTTVPWAVQFGSPMDGSWPAPRHPVQLYEAICYLLIFCFLLYLSYKPKIFLKTGKLIGLFLILVFAARFILEFWKVEQSEFFHTALTMGQVLSLPFIAIGLILFFWKK